MNSDFLVMLIGLLHFFFSAEVEKFQFTVYQWTQGLYIYFN